MQDQNKSEFRFVIIPKRHLLIAHIVFKPRFLLHIMDIYTHMAWFKGNNQETDKVFPTAGGMRVQIKVDMQY